MNIARSLAVVVLKFKLLAWTRRGSKGKICKGGGG